MIRLNFKKLFVVALGLLSIQGLNAQLNVNVSLTPEQIVQNLVGPGVAISNVTVTACDSSYGYYQSAATEIGTSQGLLLTTGKALYAQGPNNSIGNCSTSAGTCDYFDNDCPGSVLLNQAQSRTTYDATQFEFDIVPQGDSLKFKYTFASEEYNEWVGSQFNDVFGFYISGPGIGTDVNIALIPTTGQVVSINTINALTNQAFYYNNQNPLGQFVQYDGFTRNLIAKVGGLFPCETYHLKLVIADGTDHVYDSGVFIQSIESNPVLVSTATSNGLEYMVEGCSDGSITFTRQIVDDQPTEVLYWVGGSATNGVDYTPTIGNGIPFAQNAVIIPPNQSSVTFNITATDDNLPEGQEYITIYLANPLCLENGASDSINFYINDFLDVQLTADSTNSCIGNCVTLTGVVPNLPSTTFEWSSNVTNGESLTAEVCPTQATTYSLNASVGACSGTDEITINVSSIAVELTASPASCQGAGNGIVTSDIRDAIEPYTYSWTGPNGFVSSNDSLINVDGGEYCLTVTDAAGCVNSACTLVELLPSSIQIELTSTPVFCANGTNGTISVTIENAIAPSTYNWTGPNGFTSNADSLTGLIIGEYCLTLTDATGCLDTACTSVIQTNELTAISTLSDFTCNQISCFGSCDGSISLDISGGQAPYNFAWTGPEGYNSSTEGISALCAGTYELTLTDATGCEYSNSYTLTEPSVVLIEVVGSVDLQCTGVETGEASVASTGGCAPYTYSWSHSATVIGPVATNLGSGTYDVSVTDQNGCNSAGSVTIVINDPIDPLQVIIDEVSLYPGGFSVSCPNSTDGFVNVTSSAGTTPYTFEWTNNATGAIFSDLEDLSDVACGSYSLRVTDSNDCEITEEVTLTCVPEIDVVIDVQNNPCGSPTASLGAITVTSTSGGQGEPYNYVWTGPSCAPCSTADITNLDSGDYLLIVTDAQGCADSTSANIGQNDAFVATGDVTGETCPELCDGSIDITLTDGSGGGGVTPFPLSPNSTIQICFTALHTYVSDLAFHLVGPPSCGSPDILLSQNSSAPCNSGNNINSLCFTNSNTDAFSVCAAATPLSGNYGAYSNGTAIDWSPLYGCDANQPGWAVQIYDCVSLDFGSLTDATLTFSDTDGAGATTTSSYSTPIGFNSPINDNSCSAASASIFQVETTGGSGGGGGGGGGNPVEGNFTYTWSGPFNGPAPTTQDVSGLCPGDYSVLISNGDCEETLFFTVPAAESISVQVVNQIDPTCFGQNNGSIDINVLGGSGSYNYQWIPQPACFFFGATTQDVNNLPACDFTVSITDLVTGCNILSEFTLDAPQVMELTVVTSQFEGGYNLSCHNSNDGAISVFVSGGTPDPIAFAPFDYQYDWINDCSEIDPSLYGNDPNAPNATNLPGGSYGINVTDANGCLATTCLDLIAPDSIQSPAIIQNITCASDEGCITPNIQGGSSTFIAYEWTGNIGANEPNAATLCGLSAGAFTLTITDSNGCQETFDYEIMDVSTPETTVESTTDASCFATCDGTASVSVEGGEAPFTVLVDGIELSIVIPGVIDSICRGTHDLVIIDANGCESSSTITINSPDELIVLTEILIQEEGQQYSIQCSGDSTGSVNATISGGTAPYDISWTDASGTIISLSEDPSSLAAGIYCLNIIDGDACSAQSCVILTEPELPLSVSDTMSQFSTEFNLACFNSTDGFIDLTVSGGVAPYTFEWQGNNVIDGSEDQIDLGPGVYDVVVIDANFCQFPITFTLVAPPAITVDAIVEAISCTGVVPCDGSINATINNVGSNALIVWSGPNGFSSSETVLTELCAGDYIISIDDIDSGCSHEETITIVDPGLLSVEIVVTGDCALGTASACAVVTGGTAPLTLNWSNGGDLDCVNVISSGDLSVIVTDANDCPSATNEVNVQVPDAPFAINGIDTDASCGGCNGSIDVSVGGGSAGFTYQWANGEQTEDLSNLCADLYTIVVTDALGCSDSLSFNIQQSTGLLVTLDITNALCAGDSTGAASVLTNGGTPEFTYSWTDSNENVIGIESLISNLPTGSYEVFVSDASGCDTTATIVIASPLALSVTITLSEYSIATNVYNISSPGGSNGSILVDAEEGTPDYIYNWTPNTIETDENNPTGLVAGDYTLQIVDANGCSVDTVITLTDPDALKLYTALSPNGDSFNDTYVIDGVQDCPDNQFKVFNRWGNLVYEKDSYLNEWFGQDMDGNTLSDGTYFVIFEGCGAKFNTYVDLRRN